MKDRYPKTGVFLGIFRNIQERFFQYTCSDLLWRKEKTILERKQNQKVLPTAAFSKISFAINNYNKLLESFLVIGCFSIFIYLDKRRTAIAKRRTAIAKRRTAIAKRRTAVAKRGTAIAKEGLRLLFLTVSLKLCNNYLEERAWKVTSIDAGRLIKTKIGEGRIQIFRQT